MAVMLAPFAMMAVRVVAQRYAQRAALKATVLAAERGVAAPVAARAMTGLQSKITNVPLLPLGSLARQPKLLSLSPVAGNFLQRINPSRLRTLQSPLLKKGAQVPISPRAQARVSAPAQQALFGAQPARVPVSTPVTKPVGRFAGRLGRTAGAVTLKPVASLTSPAALARTAELGIYSAGYGAAARSLNARGDRSGQPSVSAAKGIIGGVPPAGRANYELDSDKPAGVPFSPSGSNQITPPVIPVQTPAIPPTPRVPGPAEPAPVPPRPVPPAPVPPAPDTPSPTPILPDIDSEGGNQGDSGGSDLITQDQQNRDNLDRDLLSIKSNYDGAVGQIRRLYNLSETDEEKELLRFQLADLEAQVTSGQEAVRNLYSEKTQTIQLLASRSRQQGTEAAQSAGSLYTQSADDLEALQESRRNAQTEQYRGLGIGASSLDSDFSGLLRTLAPIAQDSAQGISDIGSQGLDYLSALGQSMGAARQGELQSLGVSRDAAIRQSYMEKVLDRINDDRKSMNSQLGGIIAQRAKSHDDAIKKFREDGGDGTYADMYTQMNLLARDGVPSENIREQMNLFFPGQPLNEDLIRQYSEWEAAFKIDRRLALELARSESGAAVSAFVQERINELKLRGIQPLEIERILRDELEDPTFTYTDR